MRTIQDIQKLTDRELRSELGQLLPHVSLGKRMSTPNYPRNRNATYKAMQSMPRVQILSARAEAESLLFILQSD